MMHIEQLPGAARSAFETLLAEVQKILSNATSTHLSAISDSAMENGTSPTDVLSGGSVRAPGKPPFKYDKDALRCLHQAVFEASEGSLYGLVVRCRRADLQSPWGCSAKLISREEHAAIVVERKAMDDAVQLRLKEFATQPDWERASFGRDMPNKEPEVVCRSTVTGLEKFPPDARLLDILQRTEALYERRGLRLQIAYWTLRPDSIEFREYYE